MFIYYFNYNQKVYWKANVIIESWEHKLNSYFQIFKNQKRVEVLGTFLYTFGFK